MSSDLCMMISLPFQLTQRQLNVDALDVYKTTILQQKTS